MEDDRWLYALAISAVASSVAGLLVPLYLVHLGAGAAQLGVNVALASFVSAPAAILAGGYADRTGKRSGVVLTALILAALALTTFPFLESIAGVIVINAILTASLAAIGPIVTMLVVGNTPEHQWSTRIARVNTLQGYGSTGGLVLGTIWMAAIGTFFTIGLTQKLLFVVAAVFGIGAAILTYRSLPPRSDLTVGPHRSNRVATLLSRSARHLRDDIFNFGSTRMFWAIKSLSPARIMTIRQTLPQVLWMYFVAAFLFFIGFSVFWAILPIYLSRVILFDAGTIFALYLVNNIASTILYGHAGVFAGRYDIRLIQSSALGLRAIAFTAIGIIGMLGLGLITVGSLQLLLFVAAFLGIVGVTWAFIAVTGTAIVSKFAPERTRGSILGIYAALSAIAGTVGGLFGGWLASYAFNLAFGVAALLVITGGGIVGIVRQLSNTQTSFISTTSEKIP
ncbi:MAG: MFS transporter [Halobacteriaceae archaeon]